MREAISKHLWLGNAADARDVDGVLSRRIVAIIDLAMEEPPIHFPRDIIYCRIPLVDGSGNRPEIIRTAIDLTASLIDSKVPAHRRMRCGDEQVSRHRRCGLGGSRWKIAGESPGGHYGRRAP